MPPPEKIYLQWHGDADPADYPDDEPRGDDVTWCRDKIFDHDIAYVRADKLAALEAERDQLRKELTNEGNAVIGLRESRDQLRAELAECKRDAVRYREALEDATERMDRARGIIRTPHGVGWAMLDTTTQYAALAAEGDAK